MEIEQPFSRLNVCVILESLVVPAWWHSLLHAIDSHARLDLTQLLITEPCSGGSMSANEAEKYRPFDFLGSKIVNEIVDKPHIDATPIESQNLEPHFTDRIRFSPHLQGGSATVDNTTLPPDNIDVIIRSPDALPPSQGPLAEHLWMPDLKALQTRALQALSARDPFFCISLLERSTTGLNQDESSESWDAIAVHTLPLQTFSISDLIVAVHACLPQLFLTQLNWLSQGHKRCPAHRQSPRPVFEIPEWPVATTDTSQTARNHSPPTSSVYLQQALTLLYKQLRKRLVDQLFYEQWQLAYLDNHDLTESIQILAEAPPSSYRALTPPDGQAWADPHLSSHNNQLRVFFEAIGVDENLGRIQSAKLGDDGITEDPETALTSTHHLSYPFVMEHAGQHWMIPESASENMVSLFRCTNYPNRWELVEHLMSDVDVADCTLTYHEDRWWLFGNTMTHPAVNERDELRIWFADEITGPWQAHPLNPVLTGVHQARMAGGFIRSAAHLYRPCQFGAWRYGHAINLARIDRLTCEDYQESIIGQIRPTIDSPWLGCHSITHKNGLTVIDRVRRRSRIGKWLRRTAGFG